MNFLLVQFRTDASAPHEQACLVRYGGLADNELVIKNVFTDEFGAPEEELAGVAGVILGGSGQFCLTSPAGFEGHLPKLTPLLDHLIAHDIPTLGACFGHQLLGRHLGGRVEHTAAHAETGSHTIHLGPEATVDPLFTDVPATFTAQVGHKDTVTELPDGCVLLAHSDACPMHAFRYRKNIYGIQFHPELDREELIERLQLYPEYLNGQSIAAVRDTFAMSPEAPRVLKNFVRLARNRASG